MAEKSKPSGYDKYVNPKLLAVAVGAFALTAFSPIPESVRDVAIEYAFGKEVVRDFFATELFGKRYEEVEQWQAATAAALEVAMRQGISRQPTFLKRDVKQWSQAGVNIAGPHFERLQAAVSALDPEAFHALIKRAHALRYDELGYDRLSEGQKVKADDAARKLQICLALVIFVIICFATEAIPLPGVAFCIGLVLVFAGIVSRREVAALFWSDAVWFIMGSLMFAAAFVKTGVDKRICLLLFSRLAKPGVFVIIGIMIMVISPAASFISDHALAAMFLPIGLMLYHNSLNATTPADRDLGKLLMITICMATNIGGFGSPSGGARNVIIMTYMEDMFGLTMGYAQWMLFGMPFVIIMMPILWVLLRWRFKPKIVDLGPALATLKSDIGRSGRWNRQQILAVVIFILMLVGWITEKDILTNLIGVRLGIGVIAIAGAVAYLLTGTVNWRDYQEKVDWGVVWLYAGAIIFGRVLDESGAAYWIARSVLVGLASLGIESGTALLAAGGAVTTFVTNLMADGPAAAAVGPVTLNIAAVAAPGTTLIPFMGLVTSCSASFAYLLIIGTPPNAIVYASGLLEPKDFLRVGIPCVLASFLVMLAMALFYWPLLGFPGLQPF